MVPVQSSVSFFGFSQNVFLVVTLIAALASHHSTRRYEELGLREQFENCATNFDPASCAAVQAALEARCTMAQPSGFPKTFEEARAGFVALHCARAKQTFQDVAMAVQLADATCHHPAPASAPPFVVSCDEAKLRARNEIAAMRGLP
jgi:hypothetical protein